MRTSRRQAARNPAAVVQTRTVGNLRVLPIPALHFLRDFIDLTGSLGKLLGLCFDQQMAYRLGDSWLGIDGGVVIPVWGPQCARDRSVG